HSRIATASTSSRTVARPGSCAPVASRTSGARPGPHVRTHPAPMATVSATTQLKAKSSVLHEFLEANRAELIERCRAKVALRPAPTATSTKMDHGIPLFLSQLI